jgi:branched-chain amino acid transport system substrate-binding protein
MGTKVTRRDVLKAGLGAGALALGTPAILTYGRGEQPIKIGDIDPITGTYAASGESQTRGAKMALAEVNARGGVLGRELQLVIEDGGANVGLSQQKARKLIDQDKVALLMGSVSSAVSLAVSPVAHQAGVVYMDTGGHVDAVTGTQCHWNTFRICTTTYMLVAALANTLFKKFGGRWYFLTPDYAFGHALQHWNEVILQKLGGTNLGNSLAPLGTTDFSSYLIKAASTHPDVLINLTDGQDRLNSMKQAAEFGLFKKFAIGGGLNELEVLRALPPVARVGWSVVEWWWDQPNTPHVKEWVAAYRKTYPDGSYPSQRTWFGYAGLHALAMGVARAKSLQQVKVARALEGMELPPEVKLQPHRVYFRAGDHQLMSSEFPGESLPNGTYPNVFKVAAILAGDDVALPVTETGCKLDYPA